MDISKRFDRQLVMSQGWGIVGCSWKLQVRSFQVFPVYMGNVPYTEAQVNFFSVLVLRICPCASLFRKEIVI